MNAARGEVAVKVADAVVPICLTLGGLAELEQLFGCASLSDLQLRMRHLSAAELIEVLQVLVRGAGGAQSVERVSPSEAARAIAEAFRAALG
ncbi:MAG: gene transfer agent family protein [Henriciella sp.]|nr:gene transfer agent family protein [Henriciella sp.]